MTSPLTRLGPAVLATLSPQAGRGKIAVASKNTLASRRAFLKLALAWPLGGALIASLPACQAVNAETPKAIKYGRETCEHCSMLISDARFAAEVWRPDAGRYSLFDDVGCAVLYAEEQRLIDNAQARIWAADYDDPKGWIDARKAFYLGGVRTPMDYGYAAVRAPGADRVSFEAMRANALAKSLCSPRDRAPSS